MWKKKNNLIRPHIFLISKGLRVQIKSGHPFITPINFDFTTSGVIYPYFPTAGLTLCWDHVRLPKSTTHLKQIRKYKNCHDVGGKTTA